MFKSIKGLFVAALATVVFSAIAEACGGHRGGGGPTYWKDVRLE